MGMCQQKVIKVKPPLGSLTPLGVFVFEEVIP
jgi:hypothetical protein